MGEGNDLSPKERDMVNARQRIKYRHTRSYMDHEKDATQSLRELMNTILAERMSEEDRNILERDLKKEMDMIRAYHDTVELPEEA